MLTLAPDSVCFGGFSRSYSGQEVIGRCLNTGCFKMTAVTYRKTELLSLLFLCSLGWLFPEGVCPIGAAEKMHRVNYI